MRTKFPGNQIRLIDLIEELAIAKADAESFHWKCAVFCCKRSDGSGIETTEEEFVISDKIEDRFFSDAVPGQQQAPLSGVPNGECEHPVQSRNNLFAPFFITMNDSFGIRLGREFVACR